LAGHDEGSFTRRLIATAQKSAGRDNYDDKRKGCDQIEVAGIVVTPMAYFPRADFPAH
jgi:hypothetical protein